MSVEIPVVAIAFGSVTPPQGDILELMVHLGCTKEVSSFERLLQNFDKKYTVTEPINVGDNCSISIGRGTNCPLILTGRVEEIEPESTPIENYIRVRGRCWGEKIFRRVVTKTYENQKGEAIVKDLLDNYVGLSHVRDSTELVENTDTTYTLLEYKDTPVFDILKYIAETADKSGVIGFDFRVEYDGKFAFFPRNSKTSLISLSEMIEHSRCSKDIHRVRNKIMVYGAAEKPYPLDTDGQPWSDSLTEDLAKPDNYLTHADGQWDPVTGNTNLYIETSTVHTGSKSVKLECTAYMYYMGIAFTFNSDKYVNCNHYPKLCFTLQEDSNHNKKATISLEDKDGNTCRQTLDVADYDEWQTYELGVGKQNQESWTMSVFNSGPFDWENLKRVRLDFHQLTGKHGVAFVDRMHFGGCRWNATEEDSGSQSSYGLRELVEVDEELHSDNECSLRGKALLNHLSQPAEFLTLRTTCLDYSTDRLLPGDKIHVMLPNENIDSDFRIVTVEYRVSARDQALEITLELGKEKPLLADYLYGLRSTTITVEKLMRTKAGLTGGIIVGGGGGGGGGMVDHGNEWHTPDFSASPHGSDHMYGGADAFEHQHIPYQYLGFEKDASETSTSSTGYVLLIETGAKPVHSGFEVVRIDFCHNIKTTVTTIEYADIQIRLHNTRAGTEVTVATLRMTTRDDDYHTQTISCYYGPFLSDPNFQDEDEYKTRVYWKTNGSTYYSNERFLMGFSLQRTGKNPLTPWY